jgi:hypothetical protein
MAMTIAPTSRVTAPTMLIHVPASMPMSDDRGARRTVIATVITSAAASTVVATAMRRHPVTAVTTETTTSSGTSGQQRTTQPSAPCGEKPRRAARSRMS